MSSTLITRTATRPLAALLILYAVFTLLRGHDHPGGGFIGGLIAGAAFSLYAMVYGVPAARRALIVDPRTLVATGLLFALVAGLLGLARGEGYLTQHFLPEKVAVMGGIGIGTTLVFDVGVFLTVTGMVLTVLFRLVEVSR